MGSSGPLPGYEPADPVISIGPIKTLPDALSRDLSMTLSQRISKDWLRDPNSFVPFPFLPRPPSHWHGETWVRSIARRRGFAKRSGIAIACGAPSFAAVVRRYVATGEIPGHVAPPPGSVTWLFELSVTRQSTGERFGLPCFTVQDSAQQDRREGFAMGDGDGIALTAAGLHWQAYLWHSQMAVDRWVSRTAAWPFYNAAMLSCVMALEAYLNTEADFYAKAGRVSSESAEEFSEVRAWVSLARKIETWPQKWGASAVPQGTPLHRELKWLLDTRNEMVHPKESWIALRDDDKRNLGRAGDTVLGAIRHWNFSIPSALPPWLTTKCSVTFDMPIEKDENGSKTV